MFDVIRLLLSQHIISREKSSRALQSPIVSTVSDVDVTHAAVSDANGTDGTSVTATTATDATTTIATDATATTATDASNGT